MSPITIKNLPTNENDLHNYNNRNIVNHQLGLFQVKTTTYVLHSVRYRTAKRWNFVQNSLNLNNC